MLNRYALLVGIDLYLNDGSRSKPNGQKLILNNLGGCVNDTKAVREFLLSKYEFSDVSILASSSLDSNDADLTKAVEPEERWPTFFNIKRKFDLIYDRAIAGDFFFFHYSGHGAQLQRVKESPKGRLKDSSLLTMDFCCGGPAVRGWQLNQWLERLNAKGVHVVVSLDSCHSGGSWRESDVSYRTPNDWPELSNLPIDEHVTAGEGSAEPVYRHAELETSWSINPEAFTLMAACGDNERAAERVLNGKRGGAFTHELLDYLRESNSLVTYRMIRDELAGRLKGQSPEVYGRDRMLFFGSSELSSSTPLAVRIEGDKVSIPAGRAHGVHPGSEFVLFPQSFNTTLTVDEVDDFVCKAPISNSAALLLKQHHMAVPSRWHLGEETFRVLVDPVLGLEFQQSLSASLQCRIGSLLDVGQYVKGEENADALRIEMQGEEIKIHGPKLLIGYDGPVRPLRLRGNDIGILAAETAAPMAHLARFRQILNLRSQGSSEQAPFVVDIKPANGEPRAAPYPLDQKFKFVFENKGDESLHFTVMVLGPEFHIEQLYPSKDTPIIVGRSKRAFNFSMSLPAGPQWAQELIHRNHRRDIIRTIVTRGRPVSWKSLELPNVWDASQMGLRQQLLSERDAVLELDGDSDWPPGQG
ncbi:caspase domain-containing protein [Trichoderma compactum]